MTESPQEFDLEAWIEGAERPARSVTVYQKAGLIADLDRIAEQIEHAEEAAPEFEERGLTEQDEGRLLRAEYQRLAQQFHASALTIRVQGHDEDEKREIAKAHPDAGPGELGYYVLADAITFPKVTAEQLKRLAKRIGEAQFNQLPVAYHEACTEIPAVSADFLPKPSTRGDGGE